MKSDEPLSFLLHEAHASHLTADAMSSLNGLAASMLKRRQLEDALSRLEPTDRADRLKIERVRAAAERSSYLD